MLFHSGIIHYLLLKGIKLDTEFLTLFLDRYISLNIALKCLKDLLYISNKVDHFLLRYKEKRDSEGTLGHSHKSV